MINVTDYTDARDLLSEYDQFRCAECGTIEWFKFKRPPYDRPRWRCQTCGELLHETLEYACPQCTARMSLKDGEFVCHNVDCDHDPISVDTEGLIDRLSEDHDTRGMPRALLGDCPLCGENTSVNGGPDGELVCRDCNDFYAGRYSDEWYCYAIWIQEPDKIRVKA